MDKKDARTAFLLHYWNISIKGSECTLMCINLCILELLSKYPNLDYALSDCGLWFLDKPAPNQIVE